jgi:hypothetical protein
MPDKFVTIAEYMDSIRAELAKQLLEDFKILAIVVGENAGDARVGVFETIKLQVPQSKADEARQILEEQENSCDSNQQEEFEESDEPEEQ